MCAPRQAPVCLGSGRRRCPGTGAGAGHSYPVSQGMEGKDPPLLGGTPWTNTAANEQTEPEELKENEGGTDGQAWGKVVFSSIPHLCPGLRSLGLCPKARAGLAQGRVPIALPTPGLTAERLGRCSDRATLKSPLTSRWAKAPKF